MHCAKYQQQLSEYLDGTLGAKHATRMREHLLVCSHCRQEHEEMVRLRELLRVLPETSPRHDFWPHLRATLNPQSARPVCWQKAIRQSSRASLAHPSPGVSFVWKSATVLTLVAALLLVLPAHWRIGIPSFTLRSPQENATLYLAAHSSPFPRDKSPNPLSVNEVNSASLIALHASNTLTSPLAEAGRMRYTYSEASEADLLDTRPTHYGIQDIH